MKNKMEMFYFKKLKNIFVYYIHNLSTTLMQISINVH